ncbi:MAG: DinB family protein [Planctomycetes bacterium]|nr:DinB family protein [Planctomycetota bacterium]MBI3846337.1 DinB family protein [Planctomycetota bacterium]
MNASELAGHLRFSTWASHRTLDSVKPLTADEYARDLRTSFGSVRGTSLHTFGADRIWFARLVGESPGTFPTDATHPTFDAIDRDWRDLLARFEAWGAALHDADVARVIAYRNTEGKPFETPLWQIVLHVVNHASYHRGQIATLLRQLGRTPTNTDLITYYRSLAK